MIACSDSDPFKAITRQNMESKAGDYSVNDFFFSGIVFCLECDRIRYVN